MRSWKARLLVGLMVAAMLLTVAGPAMAQDVFLVDENGFVIELEDCEDVDGDLVCDLDDAFVDLDFDSFDDRFFFPFFVDLNFNGIDDRFEDECFPTFDSGGPVSPFRGCF